MQPESIKEEDSAAEQPEAYDQRTEDASMGEEPHDDQESLEDEHVEHNDDQQYGNMYEQEGPEDAGYDVDVYDNINGQGDAGNTHCLQIACSSPRDLMYAPLPHLTQKCAQILKRRLLKRSLTVMHQGDRAGTGHR